MDARARKCRLLDGCIRLYYITCTACWTAIGAVVVAVDAGADGADVAADDAVQNAIGVRFDHGARYGSL